MIRFRFEKAIFRVRYTPYHKEDVGPEVIAPSASSRMHTVVHLHRVRICGQQLLGLPQRPSEASTRRSEISWGTKRSFGPERVGRGRRGVGRAPKTGMWSSCKSWFSHNCTPTSSAPLRLCSAACYRKGGYDRKGGPPHPATYVQVPMNLQANKKWSCRLGVLGVKAIVMLESC